MSVTHCSRSLSSFKVSVSRFRTEQVGEGDRAARGPMASNGRCDAPSLVFPTSHAQWGNGIWEVPYVPGGIWAEWILFTWPSCLRASFKLLAKGSKTSRLQESSRCDSQFSCHVTFICCRFAVALCCRFDMSIKAKEYLICNIIGAPEQQGQLRARPMQKVVWAPAGIFLLFTS